MQQAFEGLKDKLLTAPVLVYPNFERPVLETDASHDGLGAVLAQRHTNRTIWLIAYARCALQGAEACNKPSLIFIVPQYDLMYHKEETLVSKRGGSASVTELQIATIL